MINKVIVSLALLSIFLSCTTSEESMSTDSILSTNNKYETIGVHKTENNLYRSVYTSTGLDESVKNYYDKLRSESTMSETVALFYKNKNKTPSSHDLEDVDKRINRYLLGGIERHGGKYFILHVNSDLSLTRGGEIALYYLFSK